MKYSLKPKYHFFPITGWLNDPNGLIYYKNKYHMFYQFNPSSPEWGAMHWGHAISDDLFKWKHLPVALYPEKTFDDNDISGIFSGSAIEKDGNLFLMYTQFFDPKCYENHEKEQQCIAFSSNGIDFEKYSKNPVISTPPTKLFHDFRDPKVWRGEDSKYYCVLGSGEENIGKVLLYSSRDLKKWEFENTLIKMDPEEFEPIIECPDFFKLGNKWVLIFSAGFLTEGARKNYYVTGNFEKNKFFPEYYGELDLGNDIYASQTFLDEKGRRILIGWVHTPERYNYTKEEGWAGIMSIPRKLSINNGLLIQEPVEEINNFIENIEKPEIKNDTFSIKDLENCFMLEIDNSNEKFEISLENSKDKIIFSISSRDLEITEIRNKKKEYRDFYHLESEIKNLRIFFDKSSFEVFINSGETVCTWRIYPHDNYSKLNFKDLPPEAIKIRKINNSLFD